MKLLLLAVALPLGATEIKTVPDLVLAAPMAQPGADFVRLPQARLPETLTSPIPGLPSLPPSLVETPRADPALAPTVAPPVPAAEPQAIRQPAVAEGARRDPAVTGAKESAEDLVRRLLRASRERREAAELSGTYDGRQKAEVFDDTPAVGATQVTRHGEYTLAATKAYRKGQADYTLERWQGPGGTRWVEKKRGPGVWQVREYTGKAEPFEGLPPKFYAEFELGDGRLLSNVETKSDDGSQSTFINAKTEFEAALAHFGAAVMGIKGTWVYGDNLAEFNRLTASGLSPERAALQTWTGKRAAAAGFTKVVFAGEGLKELKAKKPGVYEKMSALFVRPDERPSP